MRLSVALALFAGVMLAASSMLLVSFASAAAFNCTVRASTTCNAGEALLIRLNSSEPSAGYNNSHAQLANFSGTPYPYSVCCSTDAFRTLNNTCIGNGIPILNLMDTNNSHVQNGTGTSYPWDACLNITYGVMVCQYPNSACSAGYSPVVSIASSEAGDNNLTNAHVGDYSYFYRKVCCQVGGQNPPSVASATIAPINTTTRNDLECQNGATSDPDGDTVYLSYNWYRNGTSITVLNMPMDYDSGASVTHDVSGFGNHGAVSGVTFLPTGGRVGGGFSFDSTNIFLNASNASSLNNMENFTYAAWIYPVSSGQGSAGRIIDKNKKYFFISGGGVLQGIVLTGGTNIVASSSAGTISLSSWQFVAMVVYSNKTAVLYQNGNAVGSATGSGGMQPDSVHYLTIGNTQSLTNAFNGTIDEIVIFNRSLTPQEVMTLYTGNNRFLNSTELRRTEGWNCSITPIDSTGLNGSTKYSTMTYVNGSAPFPPTLNYPVNNNQSVFERFVNFSWTGAAERDGDAVTYTFNLTTSGACSVQTTQSGLSSTSYAFGELCTDQLYNWTVRACDIDGCNVSAVSNFTVASVAGVRLIVNLTQFGTFDRGQSKATDVDPIAPFVINNTGNVRVNITLIGNNSPFSTATLPTGNYTFKAGINATNAYNISGSQSSYTPVDSVYKSLIKQLNYSIVAAGYLFQVNSTARIDMNITAPMNEPPGNKQANITVQAVAG